jgi:hypothetical protein
MKTEISAAQAASAPVEVPVQTLHDAVASPISQLGYAPPVRGARHPWAMVGWGLGSSFLAVVLVMLAARFLRTDVLSWQVYYFLPVGALIISMVAATGYAIGARLTGFRMNAGMLSAVLVLQLMTYFAAEYVQFAPHHYVHRLTRTQVGFLEYLHMKNMSWSSVDGNGSRHALGGLGYLFVTIQLVAFVLVGPIVSMGAILRQRGAGGYCDLCKLYLKRRRIALFPASLPYRKLNALSEEELVEYRESQQEQILAAAEGAEMMLKLATEGDLQTIRELAGGVRPDQRRIARLPSRMELSVEFCPGCRRTTLRTTMHTGNMRRRLDEREVSNEFAALASKVPTTA